MPSLVLETVAKMNGMNYANSSFNMHHYYHGQEIYPADNFQPEKHCKGCVCRRHILSPTYLLNPELNSVRSLITDPMEMRKVLYQPLMCPIPTLPQPPLPPGPPPVNSDHSASRNLDSCGHVKKRRRRHKHGKGKISSDIPL